MKFGTLTFLIAVILFGVPAIPVRLAAQNVSSEIIVFHAPGAGMAAGSGFGIFPDSINAAGAITGHYTDTNKVNHGATSPRLRGAGSICYNPPTE